MRIVISFLWLLFAANAQSSDAPTVLIFGDSLSAGYGLEVDQSWASLLQARLAQQGYEHRVVNASISGETTEGGATAAVGFPGRNELAERYADRTGRDISNLSYYLAFNRWKSAAIIHGVYARYMAGQKSTEGIDMDEMRQRITSSLELAEEAVAT